MEISAEFGKYLTEAYMMKFAIGLAKLFAVFVFTLILLKIVKFAINRWKERLDAKREASHPLESDAEKEKRLETITSLVKKGLNILIIALAILVGLQTVGVAIGPILASAGVLGLAVGFGAQSLVKDIISGFFMIFEDQIRQGDIAMINGTAGTIEAINFRTIVLRDMSGTVHFFPNGSINTVANMTKDWSAIVLDIGVAYKEDLNKVMEVMKRTFGRLKENNEMAAHLLDEEMEVFGLNEFGDSALVIKSRIKTRPLQQWGIGREYRKLLKEEFDKENIEIPFPHQSIYFGEASAPFLIKSEEAQKA